MAGLDLKLWDIYVQETRASPMNWAQWGPNEQAQGLSPTSLKNQLGLAEANSEPKKWIYLEEA